jgi:hypothetical protein
MTQARKWLISMAAVIGVALGGVALGAGCAPVGGTAYGGYVVEIPVAARTETAQVCPGGWQTASAGCQPCSVRR